MSIFQKHLNYELLSDPSSFIIHFNMPFEMSVRGGLLLSKFKNDLILSSRGMVSIFQNEIQKYLNYSRGLGLDRNFSQFLTQAYGSPAVGVWAVNCWQWRSGHYSHQSLPFFSSPSQSFLIEGVLWSKNLFSNSCLERPKI